MLRFRDVGGEGEDESEDGDDDLLVCQRLGLRGVDDEDDGGAGGLSPTGSETLRCVSVGRASSAGCSAIVSMVGWRVGSAVRFVVSGGFSGSSFGERGSLFLFLFLRLRRRQQHRRRRRRPLCCLLVWTSEKQRCVCSSSS